MSSYLEQIRRMREAREKDESPLAAALNQVVGVRALVESSGDAKENRRQGDVMFIFTDPIMGPRFDGMGLVRHIESQVSRIHTNFGYSADKVGKYEGDYVYLACLERKTDSSVLSPDYVGMIHVILEREELEEVICKMPKGVYLKEKEGREFYTIYPTSLASCKSAVFSNTLAGAVADLIQKIVTTPEKEAE